MRFEQFILILAALAIFAGFFLPTVSLPGELVDKGGETISVSGWNLAQSALDQLDVMPQGSEDGTALQAFLEDQWQQMEDFQGMGIIVGFLFVLCLPVFFVLHAVGYLFRGLAGKQYGRGIFFALLTMGLAWVAFRLMGNMVGTPLNFFRTADLGYWLGFGGMIGAAFSLFFESKSRPSSR